MVCLLPDRLVSNQLVIGCFCCNISVVPVLCVSSLQVHVLWEVWLASMYLGILQACLLDRDLEVESHPSWVRCVYHVGGFSRSHSVLCLFALPIG